MAAIRSDKVIKFVKGLKVNYEDINNQYPHCIFFATDDKVIKVDGVEYGLGSAKQTEENIINGFSYKGNKVYLRRDNQLNYLLFANSTIFPINVKFGTSDNPIYYTFESKDEMTSFVNKIANYISTCLQDGWNKKKNIDWNLYEL